MEEKTKRGWRAGVAGVMGLAYGLELVWVYNSIGRIPLSPIYSLLFFSFLEKEPPPARAARVPLPNFSFITPALTTTYELGVC